MSHIIWLKVWMVDFKGFYCDVILPTWTISIGMQVYQTQGSDNDARTGTILGQFVPTYGPLIRRKTCLLPRKLWCCKMFKVWSRCWPIKGHARSGQILFKHFIFFSALKLGEPHKCEIKSDCNGWVKPTITFFGEVKGQNFWAKWKI